MSLSGKALPIDLTRDVELMKDGKVVKASVRICMPEFVDGVWRCRWMISHLHPEGISMTGDDALDALIRSLRFVSKFIRDWETDGWQVTWQCSGDHGGLPLIENL